MIWSFCSISTMNIRFSPMATLFKQLVILQHYYLFNHEAVYVSTDLATQ